MLKEICPILTLILGFISKSESCFARTQRVAVHGRLYCHGRAALGTRIRLYDEDFPDRDDLLDAGSVDIHGDFYLSGTTKELSTIDPMLSIFHNCDDPKPCLKRINIFIPQSFVSDNKIPQLTYQLGIINLEGNFDGQIRECID